MKYDVSYPPCQRGRGSTSIDIFQRANPVVNITFVSCLPRLADYREGNLQVSNGRARIGSGGVWRCTERLSAAQCRVCLAV